MCFKGYIRNSVYSNECLIKLLDCIVKEKIVK